MNNQSDTKNTSGLKLLLWVIFIIIIFVMFKMTNKEENINEPSNDKVNTFISYPEMINNLLTNGYEYKYVVSNETQKIIYNGKKCNNIDIGYKETNEEIIKYKIKDDKTYKIVLEKEEEITSIYDESNNFLNLNILFSNLKEYLYNIDKENNMRTINYKIDGYEVIVKTNLEYITNIDINESTYNYNFEFTNVGKCANINLNN